ncbi:MAG: type II toxin-antitoxin system RelE/ParE family toxin [Renibacterium sp.]|nr:type II toxin-antitoxin system RelE/ParE family toxin [Renibacterium sp.]
MTPYQVELAASAAKQLSKLERREQRRIQAAIELLAENPRPPGAKKLAGGAGEWRARTGDYRIIYELEDECLRILVIRIGHRRDIYAARLR